MPSRSTQDPAASYRARVVQRRRTLEDLQRRDRSLSVARGGLFLIGLLAWWLVVGPRLVGPVWLGLAVLGFAGLVVVHARVARRLAESVRRLALVERAIRRLDGDPSATEDDGARFADPQHPYAEDLDLFGPASLFARLCLARTAAGAAKLAAWLGQPASWEAVRERQAAIAELSSRLDLREDVLVLGEDVDRGVAPDWLPRWVQASAADFPALARPAALVVSLLATASLAGWLGGQLPPEAVLASLAAIVAWRRWLGGRAAIVLARLDRPGREVALLADVLGRVERERFEAPLLRRLHAALETDGEPPSRAVRGLQRLVDLADSRHNPMFAPFAVLLLWDTHVAVAAERWRRRHGPAVARWLDALGEIEALSSLAGWAFDNPDHPFAEPDETGPCLEAEALGHPLLASGVCVRNDVSLGGERRLVMVSGSNMSGKSTLLRALGCNAVLALAGAPVRARRLRLSSLRLGASIRLQDSLRDGRSRFFAEITRLRQIRDLAEADTPVLFLLDELLAGTNSEDRRVGAEAVVRALLERGALGVVSTHDLALAAIAEGLGPRAVNVHFEDTVEGDRVVFDYRLRPGVVRRGNALALMRAIGLTS